MYSRAGIRVSVVVTGISNICKMDQHIKCKEQDNLPSGAVHMFPIGWRCPLVFPGLC